MSFCVDVVSEDSFYENLILGVTKILESNERVTNVTVEKKLPVDRIALTSWEQKHSVTLPEDIRNFYLSTDGFRLKWSFKYTEEEILPVGRISINTLCELTMTAGLKELLEVTNGKQNNPSDKPKFGPRTKMFELDDCKGSGKVCLIHCENNWVIWMVDIHGHWTWLADSFVYYFRMALVHQGIPGWQATFSKTGLLPWTEQLFLLLTPHLLEDYVDDTRPSSVNIGEVQLSHIDPNIFKVGTKHINKTPATSKNQAGDAK